jgi:hypothetical protein
VLDLAGIKSLLMPDGGFLVEAEPAISKAHQIFPVLYAETTWRPVRTVWRRVRSWSGRLAQAQKLALLLPAWWQISEVRDADAARKRSLDGSFDDVGRQKCQGHHHVDRSKFEDARLEILTLVLDL